MSQTHPHDEPKNVTIKRVPPHTRELFRRLAHGKGISRARTFELAVELLATSDAPQPKRDAPRLIDELAQLAPLLEELRRALR